MAHKYNINNLRNIDDRPPEEAHEIRAKGAAAGREIQARRRTLREIYADMLELPASADVVRGTEADDPLVTAAMQAATERGKTLTLYDAIALAQAVRATRGDTAAAVYVRDSAGDKPTDKQEIGTLTPEDAELARKVAEKFGISVD